MRRRGGNATKIENKNIENSYLFSSELRVYLDWQEIFRLKFILMFTKKHLLDTLGTNVLEVEVKDACRYGLIDFEAELHGGHLHLSNRYISTVIYTVYCTN